MTAAIIDKPSAPPSNCIARDAQIAQLVKQEPELVPILERQHDPLDAACGPAAVIVREVARRARSNP